MSHREGASSTTEVRDPNPQEPSLRFVTSGSHQPLLQVLNSASDAVFGTRSYTPGARLQLPRKVPLRVEPKSFFGETPVYARRWNLRSTPQSMKLNIIRLALFDTNCSYLAALLMK